MGHLIYILVYQQQWGDQEEGETVRYDLAMRKYGQTDKIATKGRSP